MSYLRIGDLVINLMAVSAVCYTPRAFEPYVLGDAGEPAALVIHLIGMPEPLHFTGDEAEAIWAAFGRMGTPLKRA